MLAGAALARVTAVGSGLAVTQAPSGGPLPPPPSLSPPTGRRGNVGTGPPEGISPGLDRLFSRQPGPVARLAGGLDRQAARRGGRRRPRSRWVRGVLAFQRGGQGGVVVMAAAAAVAAACAWRIPASWEGWPLERTSSRSRWPWWLITPMLLITQRPAGPSGIHPFFTAGRVRGLAAAVTPQFWPAATARMRASS